MKTINNFETGSNIIIDGSNFRIILGQKDLALAVQKIAQKISVDYENKNPIIMGVAIGGLMFAFDLCKYLENIKFDHDFDMIRFSRYNETDNTAGEGITLLGEPKFDLTGRHVIIVDDVYEKGITTESAQKYAKEHGAISVEFCLLAIKNVSRLCFPIKYSILDNLPGNWLAGDGMNYKKTGRFFPFIAQEI